jgi:hypothetical protein
LRVHVAAHRTTSASTHSTLGMHKMSKFKPFSAAC